MSAIPNVPLNISDDLTDPAFTTSGKPFVATNRYGEGRYTQNLFNEQIDDEVTRSLEGVPKKSRGSRSKPSMLKYPIDIGSAQLPHAMQFKIFWRWEAKDLRQSTEAAKEESKKKIGNLETLVDLIDGGELTPDSLYRSPLSDESVSALKELINDPKALKIVDATVSDNMATLLKTNPRKARAILEQTIVAEQVRLESIETELKNGVGKVGIDEQERLLIQNRLAQTASDPLVAAAGAIAGGAVFGTLGLVVGGGAGAAVGAAGGAAGGAALGANFRTEAVYDQMVSIYLPFCTKINNEDSFLYEDTQQIVPGALSNIISESIGTALKQAAEAGIQYGANTISPGTLQALGGGVINPRIEKLFKQKDFRNFSFTWEFYPKNKKEADCIRDIVETFRYHAHPSSSDTQSDVLIILKTPAEFEIRFLSSNPNPGQVGFVENEYLPKIGRCALNSISVDYTPNSIYSSFVDNSPTAISMTLNMSEMGIITREAVEKGF